MRSIKFRAWDSDENYMFEDVGVSQNGNFIIFGHGSDGDVNHWYNRQEHMEWAGNIENPFIIMQYTGLKDKNGKEIYEGDICKRDGTNLYEVCWNDNFARYGLKIRKSLSVLVDGLTFPMYQYIDEGDFGLEIIGNIYENPELLGVDK